MHKEDDYQLIVKIEDLTAKQKLLMIQAIEKIAKKHKVEVKIGVDREV